MALARSYNTLRARLVGGALAVAVGLSAGLAVADKAPPTAATPAFDMQDALTQGAGFMQGIAAAVGEANQLGTQVSAEASVAKSSRLQELLRLLARVVKLAERAHLALQKAVARKDSRSAEREFVKLSVAYQRVLELLAQLRAETGSTTTATSDGTAEVQTTRDSDLPTADPAESPTAIDLINVDTSRPPANSPF